MKVLEIHIDHGDFVIDFGYSMTDELPAAEFKKELLKWIKIARTHEGYQDLIRLDGEGILFR